MPEQDVIAYAAVFVFGAVVGSFLNVCIYRIPLRQSIVFPASHCPACNSALRWYHNIPVLSFLVLRRQCGFCHKPISWRYPAVELLNALLYLAVFHVSAFSMTSLVLFLFVSSLIVITFIDIDHRIIPDVISLPGVIVGFAASFVLPWVSWQDSILGALLGGGSLFAVAYLYALFTGKEGMGGGDIKLLAMVGAFLGYKAILPVIFFSSLMGTAVGVPLMLIKRADGRLAIPFGPFIASASLVYLFAGAQIIRWYLGFFYV
ncbi:MAG: prepilin peptidase [Desulfuromonadaceae bacterium]|nr:prepilin peptidase [Desulfuromonadaceae bacterium]